MVKITLTGTSKEILQKNIKEKVMVAFDTGGVTEKYLTLLHDYTLTIKSTSVKTERAFSAAGYK